MLCDAEDRTLQLEIYHVIYIDTDMFETNMGNTWLWDCQEATGEVTRGRIYDDETSWFLLMLFYYGITDLPIQCTSCLPHWELSRVDLYPH